MRNKHITINPN
jgi:hypothetical protein